MSSGYVLPETPLLLYPSLAARFGVEEALLLGLYQRLSEVLGQCDSLGRTELILRREQWRGMTEFWDEEQLATLTSSLVSQGALEASIRPDQGTVRILLPAAAPAEPEEAPAVEPEYPEPAETVDYLPVYDAPPQPLQEYESMVAQEPADIPDPQPQQVPEPEPEPYVPPQYAQPQPMPQMPSNASRTYGPAPTFGGSIGWRNKRSKDELQQLFEQHEERKQRLHPMEMNWQPSASFWQLLARQSIPEPFAKEQLDEFVLYYLDKDRKETNWDQKFLAWVKREWVQKQSRDAREQRYAQERNTGPNNENARRDTREKRKRVTQSILDIRDTDW